MIFQTERLNARALTVDDAQSCFTIYGDREVMRYITSDGEAIPDIAVIEYLLRGGYLAPRPDPRFGFWALEVRDEGTVVGTVALVEVEDSEGEYEIGWHLARQHWGRGYATESGHALLRYGFEVVGLEQILALVHPQNDRSLRACERIGMKRIGDRMHQGYRHVAYQFDSASWRRSEGRGYPANDE